MTHGPKCRCVACEMVRVYLSGPPPDCPHCCVCPVCASFRDTLRRAERGMFETNDFGRMYRDALNQAAMPTPRGPIDDSWWGHTVSTHPAYPPKSYSVRFEVLPGASRNTKDDADVLAFDLLHELGIPVRETDP